MRAKAGIVVKHSAVCLPYTAQARRFGNAAYKKIVQFTASRIYAKDVLQKKG